MKSMPNGKYDGKAESLLVKKSIRNDPVCRANMQKSVQCKATRSCQHPTNRSVCVCGTICREREKNCKELGAYKVTSPEFSTHWSEILFWQSLSSGSNVNGKCCRPTLYLLFFLWFSCDFLLHFARSDFVLWFRTHSDCRAWHISNHKKYFQKSAKSGHEPVRL